MPEFDCSYCGLYATDVDHIPPVSRMDEMIAKDRFCLPACKECNRLLSNFPIYPPEDRRAFIKDRLRRRSKPVRQWTDEQLGEFGPTLRNKIRKAMRESEVLQIRLEYVGPFHFLPYYQDRRMV